MPPQPFSNQRGGQRRQSMSTGYQTLNRLSGGESAELIYSILSQPSHSDILQQLLTRFDNRVIQLIDKIGQAYRACPDHLKTAFSSLVATDYSRNTLAVMGCPLSEKAYRNARRRANIHGVGQLPTLTQPLCKRPPNNSIIDSIRSFLTTNSQPAANRTVYDENNNYAAARTLTATRAELHRKYIITQPTDRHVSRTVFYRITKQLRIFKPMKQRGTDMCEICVAGHQIQSSLTQALTKHHSNCSHAVAVRPYTTMTPSAASSQFEDVQMPTCNCRAQRSHSDTVNLHIRPYLHHRSVADQQHALFKKRFVTGHSPTCH